MQIENECIYQYEKSENAPTLFHQRQLGRNFLTFVSPPEMQNLGQRYVAKLCWLKFIKNYKIMSNISTKFCDL